MKQENTGIWKYKKLLPFIQANCRISLGEGNTITKFFDGIYFKCDNENPTGSVKDRGICFQVAILKSKGITQTVISTSGNAGISAARYCKKADIRLSIFIGKKINPEKLKILETSSVLLNISDKPVSGAFKYAKEKSLFNLRPSTDPYGSVGYRTISYELSSQIKGVDAVFIPVSSGTILTGIYEGFLKKGLLPALHAVQTEAVNPVSSIFDKNFQRKDKSIADAIVARYLPRMDEIKDIVKKTRGWGWVISDNEIIRYHKVLRNKGINCSYEGGAAYAAVIKAKKAGFSYKKPVCLLTGVNYEK